MIARYAAETTEELMRDYWPAPDLPLFRQMAPSQQHSRTSMAAADSLDEDTLNRLQRQVLAVIAAASAGLTDEEIQLHTGMNPSTERPRRVERERRGFITQAGSRKTSSGRSAVVWKAVLDKSLLIASCIAGVCSTNARLRDLS